jgi:L-ascorbate metabolism protein UlaG (beta-lactamase superfamily)
MAYTIKYLGHSSILIESVEGKKILIDPYLSENIFACIKPEDIGDIDAILVSHGAFDHLGDAFDIARMTGAVLYSDIAVVNYAIFSGVKKEKTKVMIWGTMIEHGNIAIRAVEAKHISHFSYNNTNVSGAPLSFIIRLEDGTGIYFSGDTSIFSDMKLFGELYPVKIGFFGISGLPGYAYEMDGQEGALAASFFNVEIAVPIHYPPGSEEPEIFRKELLRLNPKAVTRILKPGDIISP